MPPAEARFYFDFVDPLSYVVELALHELEASVEAGVERVGYELRPPPEPLGRSSDAVWAARWEAARLLFPELPHQPPRLVPWSRKAHELHILARDRGVGAAVRRGVFEAFFGGRDVGRIDELVDIAAAAGLDRTETKPALDVDKHVERVLRDRRVAEELGVTDVPALVVGGTLHRGFHKLTDLSTLLGGPPPGGR